MPTLVHGLIQKAKLQAEDLHSRLRVNKTGEVWSMAQFGWIRTGALSDPQDREDFLVGKLTQDEI